MASLVKILFARLLVTAQARTLNLHEVLCYTLVPVPWSIANKDGMPNKTAKSQLLHALQAESDYDQEPRQDAVMFDRMALVHSLQKPTGTFASLAMQILTMLIRNSGDSRRID